jgi:hypothetical protein
MKSDSKYIFLIAGVVLFLVLTAERASAQVLEVVNEHYLIEAEYNKEQAFAGNKNLKLKVIMKTALNAIVPRNKVIKLAKHEPPEDSNIDVLWESSETGIRDNYNQEVNTFLVKIPEGTEPKTYKIRLKFQNEADRSTVNRDVELFVGERTKSKLRIVGAENEPFIAGSTSVYNLELHNEYLDYTVNVHKVRIIPVPAGLVESVDLAPLGEVKPEIDARTQTISFKPFLSIKPGRKETIPLELGLGSMSITNWIAGFGDGSKLKFAVEYDDSNERTITPQTQESPLKIRPGDGSLLGAMFFGVLIGTGLKFYLEYLRQKGVINRKGVAMFVGITILVGIVITIIAWAGQIQIIAFKDINLSYDRPAVIFIIGLIGALGGVHYLNNWAKKFLPHETTPQKEG